MNRPAQAALFDAAPVDAPRVASHPASVQDRTVPLKHKRDARQFDIENREAARIILSDPVRYCCSLMQEWAKMVLGERPNA
jgi:hypothetical protein